MHRRTHPVHEHGAVALLRLLRLGPIQCGVPQRHFTRSVQAQWLQANCAQYAQGVLQAVLQAVLQGVLQENCAQYAQSACSSVSDYRAASCTLGTPPPAAQPQQLFTGRL
jgi:hypothetical protein